MRGIGSALALLAACAVLFGGSFTAARLARDDDRQRVIPVRETPPAVLPDTELALGPSAPDLPGLRRESRAQAAKPSPSASSPAPAAPAPAAPSEPSPQAVSNPSPAPSEPSPSEPSQPSPSEPSQPSPSEPSTPASQLPSEVEFYDSGG